MTEKKKIEFSLEINIKNKIVYSDPFKLNQIL